MVQKSYSHAVTADPLIADARRCLVDVAETYKGSGASGVSVTLAGHGR
jgi:hypothetical protein